MTRDPVASNPKPAPRRPAASTTTANRLHTRPNPNGDIREQRRAQRYGGSAANRPAPPPASVDLGQLAALASLHGVSVWRLDEHGTLARYEHPAPLPAIDWRRLKERL